MLAADSLFLAQPKLFPSEGDPLSGWNKGESWRADARYAAMVVKVLTGISN